MPQSQELLELIFAVKFLARTTEDSAKEILRIVIEERDELRDHVDKILDETRKIHQALQVQPMLLAERVEAVVGKHSDRDLAALRDALEGLRARQREDMLTSTAVPRYFDSSDVTGKFELRKDGKAHIEIDTGTVAKTATILKWVAIAISAGGGSVGIWKLIHWILS